MYAATSGATETKSSIVGFGIEVLFLLVVPFRRASLKGACTLLVANTKALLISEGVKSLLPRVFNACDRAWNSFSGSILRPISLLLLLHISTRDSSFISFRFILSAINLSDSGIFAKLVVERRAIPLIGLSFKLSSDLSKASPIRRLSLSISPLMP